MIELFGSSESDIFDILSNDITIGLTLDVDHTNGYSDRWFHSWGYLAASMMFVNESTVADGVKEQRIDAHTMFNMSSQDVEAFAKEKIKQTELSVNQLAQYGVAGRTRRYVSNSFLQAQLSSFETAHRRFLNTDRPGNFKIDLSIFGL